MRISTMSIGVGTRACNASCPFCVSKMTPSASDLPGTLEINVRNLRKSLLYAERSGVSTILLTGNGEPTLYPDQVRFYLREIRENGRFPFVELQTNGFLFEGGRMDRHLREWHELGMTTISISVASVDPTVNGRLMAGGKRKTDSAAAVKRLHDAGYAVRLNCTMVRDVVESARDLVALRGWCRDHRVEQLTIRELTVPEKSEDPRVAAWASARRPRASRVAGIRALLKDKARQLLVLPHGAIIYNWDGQNVCFNNCLTPPRDDQIRQIIFFPDGRLRYDWVYEGAIIM